MRLSVIAALVAVSSVSMAQSKREENRQKNGESVVIQVGECSRAEKKVSSNNQIVIVSGFSYKLCNQVIHYKVNVIEKGGMSWPKEEEIPGSQTSSYSLEAKEKVFSPILKTVENQTPKQQVDSLGRLLPSPVPVQVPSESEQLASVRGQCEQARDGYVAKLQKVAVPECAQ